MEVASPVPAYGNAVGYKNKSAKSKSFETIVETLRCIPSEQFPAILAFVDFLKLQNLGAAVTDRILSSENVIKGDKSESKSMDAFFDLAGKIDLSEDELKNFREKLTSIQADLTEEEWQNYFDVPRVKSNLRHPEDFE